MAHNIELLGHAVDGTQASALQCPVCQHTTPAGGTCPQCQPTPDRYRCYACAYRGPIIADEPPPVTETIPPTTRNDPPDDPPVTTSAAANTRNDQP